MTFDYTALLQTLLKQSYDQAFFQDFPDTPCPSITVMAPKNPDHGDAASNIALSLAKALKLSPLSIAQRLVENLPTHEKIASANAVAPGFINFTWNKEDQLQVIQTILHQQEHFGYHLHGDKKPVILEFVSANPTGPLHVGHGRQAALGCALSSLLKTQGYEVHKEFYYNDAGVQIDNLQKSVLARFIQLFDETIPFPEDGYQGEYIKDIAISFKEQYPNINVNNTENIKDINDINKIDSTLIKKIREFAVNYLRAEQDKDLQAFNLTFDQFYLESSLYSDLKVEKTVQTLIKHQQTYEQDGALWLKSTNFGDDKDRVMRKSDGTYTYFVPDVAYHVTKWERGFKKAINVQGSDHHGTVNRVRAGLQGLNKGIPNTYPQYVLHKMVTVMRNGEEVKISKRAGSYVTLRDLIDWCGKDAVRFFLLSRKASTEFVFDVDLAVKQTDENPVYYVQYAHARICSALLQEYEAYHQKSDLISTQTEASVEIQNQSKIIKGIEYGLFEVFPQILNADLSLLTHESELSLCKKLAQYPDVLKQATTYLSPHDVVYYVRELAKELHSYYNQCKWRCEDEHLKMTRFALIIAVRQILRNAAGIIGIDMPAKM